MLIENYEGEYKLAKEKEERAIKEFGKFSLEHINKEKHRKSIENRDDSLFKFYLRIERGC